MVEILALIIALFIIFFGFTAFTGAPYVPSKRADATKALTELYPLSDRDLLVDLGAGDGIILELAAQRGAKAYGVELNPALALLAKLRLHAYHGVTVKCGNLFKAKFPEQATVVYAFGDTRDIPKLYQKVEQEATRLKKPLYFISYAFVIPGHKPVKKVGVHFLYKITPTAEKLKTIKNAANKLDFTQFAQK